MLGDNIFHGHGLLADCCSERRRHWTTAACCSATRSSDPERYGVGEADADGRLISIEEKPAHPRSNLAITGLYFYDNDVVEIAARAAALRPRRAGDHRREQRSTSSAARARLVDLGRGFAWLDTGTHDSLLEAGQFVQVLEHRQGVRIACLEEIALRQGFIDADQAYRLGAALAKSGYGEYVMSLAKSYAAATAE